SSYAGGGFSLGDGDDPFADDAPQDALELDLPSSHASKAARGIDPAPEQNASASMPAGAGGGPPNAVPDLALPAKPTARGSTPALPAVRPPQSESALRAPQSEPALRAPQSEPALRASQSEPE